MCSKIKALVLLDTVRMLKLLWLFRWAMLKSSVESQSRYEFFVASLELAILERGASSLGQHGEIEWSLSSDTPGFHVPSNHWQKRNLGRSRMEPPRIPGRQP